MHITVLSAKIPRTLPKKTEEKMRRCMPEVRLARLDSQSAPLRAQALCAYALLKHSVGGELPEMFYTASGKPYFKDRPEMFFSLSHTDGAVLCAVADAGVGADIERLREVSMTAVRRMGAENSADFIECWVRRESRAKYLGESAFAAPMRFLDNERDGKYYRLALLPCFVSGVFCGGEAEIRTETVNISNLL